MSQIGCYKKHTTLGNANQELISFQMKRDLINLWLSTRRSYFMNNGFEVTDIKFFNKDTCQQLKAHQEQDGGESYVLNFFYNRDDCDRPKNAPEEMLQTRIPALENLYEVKFKIKGTAQKNDTSNTYVKKIISSCETTVASTDKNGSIISNINENTKHPVNENKGKEETLRKLKDFEIINFMINNSKCSDNY